MGCCSYRQNLSHEISISKIKFVAVIGAGPAGLVSAKYCLENGLVPIVFDKSSTLGGLWKSNGETAIWRDFPWPKNLRTSLIPFATEVYKYLNEYANKFDLHKHLRFGHDVTSITPTETNQWVVTANDKTERFNAIMIATGLHQKPHLPTNNNFSAFKGLVLHSNDFRSLNDQRLKGKKVIVVGSGMSACEISSYLVGHASSVTSVFHHPTLIAPRLIAIKAQTWSEGNHKYNIIPFDLMLNKRVIGYPPQGGMPPEEVAKMKMDILASMFPEQTNPDRSVPSLYVELDLLTTKSLKFSICDIYYQMAKSGEIKTKCSKIKQFVHNGIELDDGSMCQANVVIFCTGYELAAIDILPKSVLDKLQFNKDHDKFPLITYKGVWHPDVPNLTFINQSESLYFAGAELHAKWVTMVLSGKKSLPDDEFMRNEIKKVAKKRSETNQLQFTHDEFMINVDDFAKECGWLTDINDYPLNSSFWQNAFSITQFGDKDSYEAELKLIKEIEEQVYEFERDEFSYDEVVNKFATKFPVAQEIQKRMKWAKLNNQV